MPASPEVEVSTHLITILVAIVSGACALLGSAVTIGWSMSGQFEKNRKAFYTGLAETEKKIISKLEYHERHDDDRFQEVSDRIWGIELRNASKDGVLPREYPIHRKPK